MNHSCTRPAYSRIGVSYRFAGCLLLAAATASISFPHHASAQTNPEETAARASCAQSEDIERQISGCSAVIKMNPRFSLAYSFRGIAYKNRARTKGAKSDMQLAISDFSKAIELKSDAADPYILRGNAFAVANQKASAIADYRAALQRNPSPGSRQAAEQGLKSLGAKP